MHASPGVSASIISSYLWLGGRSGVGGEGKVGGGGVYGCGGVCVCRLFLRADIYMSSYFHVFRRVKMYMSRHTTH